MLEEMVNGSNYPGDSLYVHVPFCAQKCSYCAFFSAPSRGDEMQRYVRALGREFELIDPPAAPRTIFFGGGTPSILNLEHWRAILEGLQCRGWLPAREFTIECNPATVSLDKARLLREFGVNRVSMGVQSLDEGLLDRLGRVHSRNMVFRSYDILRRAGFENVNLDLMFAIPGQTLEVWRETLREVVALQSEHLSSYEVIYEEDTALYAQLQQGAVREDEDLACTMYEMLVEAADRAGFRQYEVANFAKDPPGARTAQMPADVPARACLHNVNYWRGGDFHGAGPSATGYVNGTRMKNWANTGLWCEQLENGRRAIESRETLSPLGRAGETAAFGLRMLAGWPYAAFEQVTGFDLRKEWAGDIEETVRRGWGISEPDRFRLSAQGLRFADAAAQLFLR
jgi:oxygen-independent coproporphyrinogen-3 oxidase